MIQKAVRFIRCAKGSMAATFAIAATALFMVAGGATDYGIMLSKKAKLQSLADSAAIAAARELTVSNVTQTQIVAAAKNFAQQEARDTNSLTVSVTTDLKTEVGVELAETWSPIFAHFFATGVTPIKATAAAKLFGGSKLCVLGLDEVTANTIKLANSASLTANSCAVVSNSTSSNSLVAGKSATLTAGDILVAGGFSGSSSSFKPTPTPDSPKLEDPLADRTPPSFSGCDHNAYTTGSGASYTLYPGVYCGGLTLSSSTVTFEPGVYVIKDGPLDVVGTAQIKGENVGFYLTGADARFNFSSNTSVSLTAPATGPMAGLLFFADRNSPLTKASRISSDDARQLLGTIYMPNSQLMVDANKPVADQSAYTAILVRLLTLMGGPKLVLNSNYGATDIPAPASTPGNQVTLVK